MRLREYRNEDAKVITSWISDEKTLYQWSADRIGKFPLQAQDLNENYAPFVGGGRFIPLSAVDEEDCVVGHLFIRYPNEADDSEVRFGFVIVDPALHGQGNGKQMLLLAMDYARKELGATKITLGVFANNESAKHCYEAAGFRSTDSTYICKMSIGEWECIEMQYDAYIQGNKEAWEEAFALRNEEWCSDLDTKVRIPYSFFCEDLTKVLRKYDLKGKSVGQFCCNNGRELLSLVQSTGAKEGIGFDIAENMVAYGNEKAQKLSIPCKFVAGNILELDDTYENRFDFVIITIGATCWFKSMAEYFAIVSKCMKEGGCIVIHEQHPFTNMIATAGDDEYEEERPFNCVYSYFDHKWIGTSGMGYMTWKEYESKVFTDYTHSVSEMLDGMCKNHLVITGMQEFDYDISGGMEDLTGRDFPLSMIIEGKKIIL